MNKIIKAGSSSIDIIQNEIYNILSNKEEKKYNLIIEMTEQIAKIAWDTCFKCLTESKNTERDKIVYKYIKQSSYSNGTIFTDEELALRSKKIGYVYILKEGDYFRVGRSINVVKRVKAHFGSSPASILFYSTPQVEQHIKLEAKLHKAFKNNTARGEWFLSSDENVMNVVTEILKGFKNVHKQ